jgi:hypothetical protein
MVAEDVLSVKNACEKRQFVERSVKKGGESVRILNVITKTKV